jgi:hypothetical protein
MTSQTINMWEANLASIIRHFTNFFFIYVFVVIFFFQITNFSDSYYYVSKLLHVIEINKKNYLFSERI